MLGRRYVFDQRLTTLIPCNLAGDQRLTTLIYIYAPATSYLSLMVINDILCAYFCPNVFLNIRGSLSLHGSNDDIP